MEIDNLITIALAGFGVISALSGYFIWSVSNQIQVSLSNIKDLDHLSPIFKVGEKVIISGLISCANTEYHVTPT